MVKIEQIGIIRSAFDKPADPFKMREKESSIEVFEKYQDGLQKLEKNDYIQVIFDFHLSNDYKLVTRTYSGEVKGVFASCSPHRPSNIGVTTVKLLKREGNILRVKGLDAVNGSPLLDLKPYVSYLDEKEEKEVDLEKKKKNPLWSKIKLIRNEELEELLLQAGELHGHYCPGLALGVMAGVYLMKSFREETSDGLEDLLLITETNSCFADGLQFITGCTFGNNALIYRDFGKIAGTLTNRNGQGIRVSVRNKTNEIMKNRNPQYTELFNKVIRDREGIQEEKEAFKKESCKTSFLMLTTDYEQFFTKKNVETNIPPYAPIMDSIICDNCGEKIMASRVISKNRKELCLSCAEAPYYQLTGFGLHKVPANNDET
jgi:formylmethanofuran dehydrogenase subunit E